MNVLIFLEILALFSVIHEEYIGAFTTKYVYFKKSERSYQSKEQKLLPVYRVLSKVECMMHCSRILDCSSASYHTTPGTCQLYVNATDDTDDTPIEWISVFHLQTGSGYMPYETWLRGPLAVQGVYRSSLIDNWKNLTIDQVKVDLLVSGESVHHVIFNGTGTNETNWLSSGRIIDSSWTDIRSYESYHKFSLKGNKHSRQMNMNQQFVSCDEDRGWMTAVVHAASCPLTSFSGRGFPFFAYAGGNTLTHWSKDYEVADALLISVHQKQPEEHSKTNQPPGQKSNTNSGDILLDQGSDHAKWYKYKQENN